MQVEKINNTNVSANLTQSPCTNQQYRNCLGVQTIDDTFASSKGKKVSFGSLGGVWAGSGLGLSAGMLLSSVMIAATGGAAAPLILPVIATTTATGGAVGKVVTGPDKKN